MFGAIALLNFALQAARREEGLRGNVANNGAALLDFSTEQSIYILQVNEVAERAGVTVGMTPAQALARCPALRLLHRASASEATLTAILLQYAERVSPLLEATAPGSCVLDLRHRPNDGGRAPPPDPHQNWAHGCVTALGRLGLAARVGVAPSPDLAMVAAGLAKPYLRLEKADEFFRDQPVSVLAMPGHLAARLASWGVRTLGAFAALPRVEIGERMGAEALHWWDLAAGRPVVRPLRLVRPPAVFQERCEFDHGVENLTALAFTLRRLLDALARRLQVVYLVIGELELRLGFEDCTELLRTFRIAAPTTEVTVLERIVLQFLESVRAPAPLVAFSLTAQPTTPTGEQFSLLAGGHALRDPNRFAETLARLAAVVGHDAVGSPIPGDTHRPDIFHLQTPAFLNAAGVQTTRTDNIRTEGEAQGLVGAGPPLRRHRPALAAQVRCEDGRPVWISCQVVHGTVLQAAGPWMASGDWWESAQAWRLAEWDAELASASGERCPPLVRLGFDGKSWWFLGVYD